MSKRVRRSFDACWTCRRRRVACDGAAPTCTPCHRLSRNCEGYNVRLAWVDGKRGTYQSHSRRTLDATDTWAEQPPYSPAQLEHLTSTYDEGEHCECTNHTAASNPFRVLRSSVTGLEPVTNGKLDTRSKADTALSLTTPTLHTLSNAAKSSSLTTPNLPTPLSKRHWRERMLLHHFVNQTAALMMPIDCEANPWRSVYPSIAMQSSSYASQSLYNAILSQSAFHLSLLHAGTLDTAREYRLQATERHCAALTTLRKGLDHQLNDFTAYAAVLYTLAQIEGCYAPELHEWRQHFLGVTALLSRFCQESPWLISSDAWVISQSLALSFEIACTGCVGSTGHFNITEILLGSVSRVHQFGYTIGASSNVIQSISKIRQLAAAATRGESTGELFLQSGKILGELQPSATHMLTTLASRGRQEYLQDLHQRIFRNAAIIYLRRSVFNVVPSVVQEHVSKVLCDTMDFLTMDGGSISLWPVFIAAVESCAKEEKDMVQRWLDYSCGLGISNRHSARHIIQEVWNQRDRQATSEGTRPEDIAIDWRQVQSQLDIDLLLL